jgi:hypothetical protein
MGGERKEKIPIFTRPGPDFHAAGTKAQSPGAAGMPQCPAKDGLVRPGAGGVQAGPGAATPSDG